MATYKERRAQIWILQVRTKGTKQAWSPTSAHWYHTKERVQEEIRTMNPVNLEQYEYRPCRYIATK